jgi:NADPH2:quinone reductase
VQAIEPVSFNDTPSIVDAVAMIGWFTAAVALFEERSIPAGLSGLGENASPAQRHPADPFPRQIPKKGFASNNMANKPIHAMRIHRFGGPEEMVWETVEVGHPGPGQARIRHTAAGVNFVDTIVRRGLHGAALPVVLGREGAGVVEEIGPGVTNVRVGDRVGYAPVQGAFCEERLIDAKVLVKLPDAIDDRTAAAIMLQGMTVQYLIRQIYPLKPGDTVLMHAAAGGVGLFLLAKAHGCHDTILYTQEDFVARVLDLTGGKKVNVVYDSVGKDTFAKSLDCLAQRGHIVSFGRSSGPVPLIDMTVLAARGGLTVTQGALLNFVRTPEELDAVAQDLFNAVLSGKAKPVIKREYAMKDAGQALLDLEGRGTTGKLLLLP